MSKCAKDVTDTAEHASATVADIDADKYTEADADADIDTAFTCILQQLTALCASTFPV